LHPAAIQETEMDLEELYRCLQDEPRDARWLLRRVGHDYADRIENLRRSGRPVQVSMETVAGQHRAVYRATDPPDLLVAAS
jgi:hypothetical protein